MSLVFWFATWGSTKSGALVIGSGHELGVKDPEHKQDFMFAILRVFDPNAPTTKVNAAESHFKRALGTRQFGFTRN